MASTFGLYTTHPGLVRCQLARLEGQLDLSASDRLDAVGVGSFVEEGILLRRLARSQLPGHLSELFTDVGSEAMIAHAQKLRPSQSVEEDVQPLRFRRWLFALDGELPEFPRFRQTLEAGLPEYLKRHVSTDTEPQAAFALFLSGMREIGRTDDRSLEGRVVAEITGRAARALSRLSAEAGASRVASFALLVSNGSTLVAARLGGAPLFYTLLEGAQACDLCGVTAESSDLNPGVRAHRRSRTVAIATQVRGGRWMEVAPGQALVVNEQAEIELISF